MGTSANRRQIHLKPIYDQLGPKKAAALIHFHALTGCDTTGHLQGKGKNGCFNKFLQADVEVVAAICDLGCGVEPSPHVYDGCEAFLCSHFRPKGNTSDLASLRWQLFKQLKPGHGVEKLPPTPGAWREHIRRAHVHANVWQQDIIAQPKYPDPLTLGWQLVEGRLVSILSQVPPAPQSVLQLLRCNCGSSSKQQNKCVTKRCTCKSHGVVCTELCYCEANHHECQNNAPDISTMTED